MDTSMMPVATTDSKHTFTEETFVPLVIDLADMWETITGEYFHECKYWVSSCTFDGAHPDHPAWSKEYWTPSMSVTLTYENEVSEEATVRLTAEDFARAYIKLVRDGWSHCGGCGIDDPDACVQDAVVQTAIFDDVIFG
jgi:hypothetical protein